MNMLDIKVVPTGDAATQAAAIVASLTHFGVSSDQLASITLDNCATNLGCSGGVGVLLATALDIQLIVVGCDMHVLNILLINALAAAFGKGEALSEDIHVLQTVFKIAYLLGANWEWWQEAMRKFHEEIDADKESSMRVPSTRIQRPIETRWWTVLLAMQQVLEQRHFLMLFCESQANTGKHNTNIKKTWELAATGLASEVVHAQMAFLVEYGAVFHFGEMSWSQQGHRAAEMPERVLQRGMRLHAIMNNPVNFFPKTEKVIETLNLEDQQRLRRDIDRFLRATLQSHTKHSNRWLQMPLVLGTLATPNGPSFARSLLALQRPAVLPDVSGVRVVPLVHDTHNKGKKNKQKKERYHHKMTYLKTAENISLENLDGFTVTLLKEQLRNRGIKVKTNMKKPELVQLMRDVIVKEAAVMGEKAAAEAAAATANEGDDDDDAMDVDWSTLPMATGPEEHQPEPATLPVLPADPDLASASTTVPQSLLELVAASDHELALWFQHPVCQSDELTLFASEMNGPAEIANGNKYPTLSKLAADTKATPHQSQHVEGTFNNLDLTRSGRSTLAPARASAEVRYKYNAVFPARRAVAKRNISTR